MCIGGIILSEIKPREIFGFDACDTEKPYIFVSYSHKDAPAIAPIVQHLNKNGVPLWYDDGLHAGEEWLKMLLNKISEPNCLAIMIFISNFSIESPFVRAETHHAFSEKKPIYSVYLEDEVRVDPSMQAYISQLQSTFISEHAEISEALEEVLSASKLLLEQKPVARIESEDNYKSADELWREAEILIKHRGPDGSLNKLSEAEAKYRRITDLDSTDYRGWIGLLKCRCMVKPSSPEHAAELLADTNNYYCYLVSCERADDAEDTCTQYNDFLWNNTMDMFETYINNDGVSPAEKCEYATRLPHSSLLTAVSPAVTARYTEITDKLNAAVEENKNKIKEKEKAISKKKKRRVKGAVSVLVTVLSLVVPMIIMAVGTFFSEYHDIVLEFGSSEAFRLLGGYVIGIPLFGAAILAVAVWSIYQLFKGTKTTKNSAKYIFAWIAFAVVFYSLGIIAMIVADASNAMWEYLWGW